MFDVDAGAVLLAVNIFVPLFLIITNNEPRLLAWICVIATINIFDPRIAINLPAARVAGLLLLPQAFKNLPLMLRSGTGKAVIAGYVCLVVNGAVFGFLFPWPDEGLIRAFNQLPEGRTIVYLLRTTADISLTIFVARQIVKRKCVEDILKYILIGTSIAALSGIFEFVTRIDLFEMITGMSYNVDTIRVRGFCYEPRGLGLMTLYGLLFSVILSLPKRTPAALVLVILNAAGFLISGSTSAYIAFLAGALAMGLYYKRARNSLVKLSLVTAFVIGCIFVYSSTLSDYYSTQIGSRLSGERYGESENFLESIAFRMEIFDGPALLFLADNPIYLLSGTGPGLIGIPATPYKPPMSVYSWLDATGINSPPTMGLLLELSNTGVIGLWLWFVICLFSFRAFNNLALYHPDEKQKWLATRAAFVTGAAIYLVQTSPLSVIWPILVGIGVGADYLAQLDKFVLKTTPLRIKWQAPSTLNLPNRF